MTIFIYWRSHYHFFLDFASWYLRTDGIRLTMYIVQLYTSLVNALLVLNESLQFVVDVKTNCSPELSVVRKGWLDNLANLGPLTWGRVQSSDDYFLIREESWGVLVKLPIRYRTQCLEQFLSRQKTEIKTLREADVGANLPTLLLDFMSVRMINLLTFCLIL